MCPLVRFSEIDPESGRILTRNVSLFYWYQRFHEVTLYPTPDTTQAKAYREELFGVGELEEVPPLYADYGFYKSLEMTEEAFNALELHTRARIKAYEMITNIVELRKAHLRIMKQRNEEHQRKREAEAKKNA